MVCSNFVKPRPKSQNVQVETRILYNGGKQNCPFFKTADFSINNAINPWCQMKALAL